MRKNSRPVTIKDIARILKISISTVSRALRDTHDVNQETKSKVLSLASELNYKPNFNATGLAKGTNQTIGIIIPFINNYYFSTVITGIQEVVYKNNYNLILFITNDSAETELNILQNLATSRVDGLLVALSTDTQSSEHFKEIIEEGTPVVFFDRVAENINTSKVTQDDFNGAFEAVEHLYKQGYTKIAHIAGPKGMQLTEKRLQGYKEALKKYNLSFRDEWIVHSGFSQECGEKDMNTLLQCTIRPDAVFAVNDRKALGAMIALKNKKIKVGKQVGVIGFTNDPLAAIVSPSLTTIAEPAYEIGKKSCELLFNHMNKKRFQPLEIIIPGKLVVRESTDKSSADALSR